MKELITSKFNKDNFVIDAMSTHDLGDIDPLINDFVMQLNESEDIMTLYSCEGHKEKDGAYLFFIVNDKGWDNLWMNVIPELSIRFARNLPELPSGIFQTEWFVSTKIGSKKGETTGISIHCQLTSFEDIFTWEDKKEYFWKVLTEVFLKHFEK